MIIHMKFKFLMCLFLFLGVNHSVVAAYFSCASVPIAYADFTLPVNINVPTGTPNGIVLHSRTIRTTTWAAACSGDTFHYVIGYATPMTPIQGMNGVFATNVNGIGIRVTESNYNIVLPETPIFGGATWNPSAGSFGYSNFRVEIIKYGPVGRGSLILPNPLVNSYWSTDRNSIAPGSIVFANLTTSGSAPIMLSTCRIESVPPVDLKDNKASEFTGVGSFTSAISFKINLSNCPSGWSRVQYKLDPLSNIIPGTENSVVSLSSSSTAKNIGVQILDYNSTPIKLSTPITLNSYNRSTGGSYSIPLKARYYQTGNKVGAGSGNATLEFSITYE